MLKIIDCKDIDASKVLNREIADYGEYETAVKEIIKKVREEGDEALRYYAKAFDKVELTTLTVSDEEIKASYEKLDPSYVDMLKRAAANIREYHAKQLEEGFEIKREGAVIGQRYCPIEKVGVYVPGGTASYPSTVLMNVIPASIAGVKDITMTSPPARDGAIRPELLAAADIAGVTRIVKIGGAGAIAALAYGTETVKKVDKIVGPGNIYVALAKKLVFGTVGIDMVAGPSEILIVADNTADPKKVAADLLSQAEHDKLATAVLITDDRVLAEKVQAETERQLNQLPRKEIAAYSIDNNGKILITDDLDKAVALSNAIAPEHLELCVNEPFELLKKVTNAGSVFLGNNTPEALGDYCAGPNHTLPTSGSARFSSPLSVYDFRKRSSYLYFGKSEFDKIADDVIMFAESEGLQAHANAVRVRK